MTQFLLLFLILLIACNVAPSTTTTVSEVEKTVINEDKLAALDKHIEDYIERGIIAGGTFYTNLTIISYAYLLYLRDGKSCKSCGKRVFERS